MKMKKLDKSVLTLWYIRAAILALALIGVFVGVLAIAVASGASEREKLIVFCAAGVPVFLLLGITLIMPALRYRMYEWGYDDKRIIVKQGVIFRRRAVIPVCQIQDLHRTQGPLMMMLKLSGVTISTAGSNFDISTLTTDEADRMIDELEHHLEIRVGEQKNEKI